MNSFDFTLAFLPGIGPGELILIFLVVLIIFGPQKLPQVGKAFGDFFNEFKKATNKISHED